MTITALAPATLTSTHRIDDIDATGWLVSAITITVTDDGGWQAGVTGYDVATERDETLNFTSLDEVEMFGGDLTDIVSDLVDDLAARLARTTAGTADPDVELIPAEDLKSGHVVAYFDGDHRISHIAVEDHHDLRLPARRIAVGLDGWELTLLPGQRVPVRPADPYEFEVFRTSEPAEPYRRVRLVAESEQVASTVARRLLGLLGAGWGDVYSTSGGYVDTVVVSW